jgi:hypothetical protein
MWRKVFCGFTGQEETKEDVEAQVPQAHQGQQAQAQEVDIQGRAIARPFGVPAINPDL